MTDTIELLEAIGSDASLRHASKEYLANVLEQADASEGLTAAVVTGDGAALSVELGHAPMQAPQISQSPGHEEEQPDQTEDEPQRSPDKDKSPPQA